MQAFRLRSQFKPLSSIVQQFVVGRVIRTPLQSLHFFEPLSLQPRRFYHPSTICQKKASGKDKDKGKNKNQDEEEEVALPDLSTYSKSMDNTVKWFTSELDKIKVGRINADMFSELPVETYGSIGKAGQVSLPTPTKLRIALFDPSISKSVVDALKNCGMGLNPQVEGTNITAVIPKPSKESRDLMLKNASKVAEKVKLDVRNFRKNAIDEFKKLKNKVSDDDIKRLTKEIDNFTQDRVNKIEQLFKAKEKEISSAN
eukprot:gene2345-2491_t